jgi:hypothetical protein
MSRARAVARLAPLIPCLVLAMPALAQPGPQPLGEHGAWIAATYLDGREKVCYAFTRATRSDPGGRGEVMLTVSHRPGTREALTLSPGYAYPRDAAVKVTVGPTQLAFYAVGSNAAARDRAAAIRSFRNGREVVATGPLARGRGMATDVFSLAGFGAALDAIDRACPPPGRPR